MAKFEESLTTLEALVDRLERGDLTLDESVRLYEQGVHLSNACKTELDKAEGRIQILLQTQGNGVQVADMDLGESSSEDPSDGDH